MIEKLTHHFSIPSLKLKAKDFNEMPFGRQMEHFKALAFFQTTAKSIHLNTKTQSLAKALKEFKQLYNPTAFYCLERKGANWYDDSTEIWYND